MIKRPTICLNMIVKDESHVIERCLNQMLPYIDSYCIVDTGSKDNTPQLIEKFMNERAIPGKVVIHSFQTCECHASDERATIIYKGVETPYFDFGKNRTYALQQCYGMSDYVFVMDADDTIVGQIPLDWNKLEVADNYSLKIGGPNFTYFRPLIFRNDPTYAYQFKCPLHEFLDSKMAHKRVNIHGDYRISHGIDGGRGQDPDKYLKDALILEKRLNDKEDPNYSRYVFYCAQSWKDYKNNKRAMELYRVRGDIVNGWSQERFYSLFQLATLMGESHTPWNEIEKVCLEAYAICPQRSETLCILARHYLKEKNYPKVIEYGSLGVKIPYPPDGLFVYKSYYDNDLPFLLAEAYLATEKYNFAKFNYEKIVNPHSNWKIKDKITKCEEAIRDQTLPKCLMIIDHHQINEATSHHLKLLSSQMHLTLLCDNYRFPYVTYGTSEGSEAVLARVQPDYVAFYDGINSDYASAKHPLIYIRVRDHFYQTLDKGLEIASIHVPNIKTLIIEASGQSTGININDVQEWSSKLKSELNSEIDGESVLLNDPIVKPPVSIGKFSPKDQIQYYSSMDNNNICYWINKQLACLYLETSQLGEVLQIYETKYKTSPFFQLMAAQVYFKQQKYGEGYELACKAVQRTSEFDFDWAEEIRDRFVEHIFPFTEAYPSEIIKRLTRKKESQSKVMFSITTCKRLDLLVKTINSFLNCCTDLEKIDKWVLVDDNSDEVDRQKMINLYPFFEFHFKTPEERGHSKSMNIIHSLACNNYDYLLHIEDDWHFVEKRAYITESIEILKTDPNYLQVLFNRATMEVPNYQRRIDGGIYKEQPRHVVHEHYPNGSYERVLLPSEKRDKPNIYYWPDFSFRPSLTRVSGLERLGKFAPNGFFEETYALEASSAGYKMCFLDTFCCYHIGKKTWERHGENAYTKNNMNQFTNNDNGDGFSIVVITTRQWTETWRQFKEHNDFQYSIFKPNYAVPSSLALNDNTVEKVIEYNKLNVIEQLMNRYNGQPERCYLICRDNVFIENLDWWIENNSVIKHLNKGDCLIFKDNCPLHSQDLFIFKSGDAYSTPIYYNDSLIPLKFTIDGPFKIDEEITIPPKIDGYRLYPTLDSMSNDYYFNPHRELDLADRVKRWASTSKEGFNTLGYVKSKINTTLIKLPFLTSIKDGIYIKE